jgi:hypothetical protein
MKRTLERHSDGAGDLRSNGGCGGTPLGGALVASTTILLHISVLQTKQFLLFLQNEHYQQNFIQLFELDSKKYK